ncbi:hypothetical protein C8J38_11023 [Rhizobium sp. PP-WC-2G-219]|nr:hypothetical protein C8J38_11023 [Rhizobium sp. PP-WC-2G-219]
MFNSERITEIRGEFNPAAEAKGWRIKLRQLRPSPSAMVIALALVDTFCKRSARCRPTIAEIVAETGVSRSSTINALEELRELGLIDTSKPRARGPLLIALMQPQGDHVVQVSRPRETPENRHVVQVSGPLYAHTRAPSMDAPTLPIEDASACKTADDASGGPAGDVDDVAISAFPPRAVAPSCFSSSGKEIVRDAQRAMRTGRTCSDAANGHPKDRSAIPLADVEPDGSRDARPELEASRARNPEELRNAA